MLYKELFTSENGLWQIVATLQPELFKAIFPDSTPELVDAVCLFKYGNKVVCGAMEQDNYTAIIAGLVSLRMDGWKRQAEAMLAEYNAIRPNTVKVTTTEQRTYNESGNTDTANAKKAFNDEMFTDDEQQRQEQQKEHTEGITNEKTTEGTGTSVSEAIEREYYFRRTQWQESIIWTLVADVTLDIYVY